MRASAYRLYCREGETQGVKHQTFRNAKRGVPTRDITPIGWIVQWFHESEFVTSWANHLKQLLGRLLSASLRTSRTCAHRVTLTALTEGFERVCKRRGLTTCVDLHVLILILILMDNTKTQVRAIRTRPVFQAVLSADHVIKPSVPQ